MKAISVKSFEKKITDEMHNKYFKVFSKRARYRGNGVYACDDIYSSDTRDLFIRFVAASERVLLKED